jgi:hypothetical protein
MKYYYSLNNERFGPVDKEDLRGKISRETLVWFQGLDNWKMASEIPELLLFFQETPPPLPFEIKAEETTVVDVRILKDKSPIITPKGEVVIANELKDNFILIVIALIIGVFSFFISAGIKNNELSKLSSGFDAYVNEHTDQFNTLKNGFFYNDNKNQNDSLYDAWIKNNEQRLDDLYSKSKELNCYVSDYRFSYSQIPDMDGTRQKIKNIISYNFNEARDFSILVFFITIIILVIGRYALKSIKWVGDRT